MQKREIKAKQSVFINYRRFPILSKKREKNFLLSWNKVSHYKKIISRWKAREEFLLSSDKAVKRIASMNLVCCAVPSVYFFVALSSRFYLHYFQRAYKLSE